MAANYNKLWKLLIDKGMTKTDLRMKTGMSTSTLAKMSKNENVSLDVILSTLSATFVKYKSFTVLPYPVKYLNEYILMIESLS